MLGTLFLFFKLCELISTPRRRTGWVMTKDILTNLKYRTLFSKKRKTWFCILVMLCIDGNRSLPAPLLSYKHQLKSYENQEFMTEICKISKTQAWVSFLACSKLSQWIRVSNSHRGRVITSDISNSLKWGTLFPKDRKFQQEMF